MKRLFFSSLVLMLAGVAIAAGGSKLKSKTITLQVTCSECDRVSTVTLAKKDARCTAGYATNNGVMSTFTATIICPVCKEQFSTTWERFVKSSPKAVVLSD